MGKRHELIGTSEGIREVEDEIQQAARSDAKVLITGESGVGKEVVAHLIHVRSRRASSQLVAVNCAGVPDSLLETEMFGHVQGSFTDAYRDKRGWLEMSNGGTFFMDEVGEMSLRMQALMLRFLETGEIQRVGAERNSQPLNVRVIAATHRRLLDRIADKSFREDLYYRLNVIQIRVPPLRERTGDIAMLLKHFLKDCSEMHGRPEPDVSMDAMHRLLAYPWPGNVRELKNVAERLILRVTAGSIGPEDLPAEIWHLRATDQTVAALPAIPPCIELFDRVVKGRESFWSTVYEPFLARDLTRDDLRGFIRLGLEETRGNYKLLVASLNIPPEDYKRFMSVLRKHQCHLAFQQFRVSRRTVDKEDFAMSARAS